MNRRIVSHEELVIVINTVLKSSNLADGDCQECHVNGLNRLVEPDENGCNWELSNFSGPRECSGAVVAVVNTLRLAYNLNE